jgi:hypothetical protein
VADANGLPLHVTLTGGQQHDSVGARALLEGLPSERRDASGRQGLRCFRNTNVRAFTWRLGEHTAP